MNVMKIDHRGEPARLDGGFASSVLLEHGQTKVRRIALAPGARIPPCQMQEDVVFVVVTGRVTFHSEGEEALVASPGAVFIADRFPHKNGPERADLLFHDAASPSRWSESLAGIIGADGLMNIPLPDNPPSAEFRVQAGSPLIRSFFLVSAIRRVSRTESGSIFRSYYGNSIIRMSF